MIARAAVLLLLLSRLSLAQAPAKHVPTIDELLTIETIGGGAQISPDGNWVAYTVNGTDFKSERSHTRRRNPLRRR
jgi:hypothetical protein